MEEFTFDRFARALGTQPTRRGLLGLLGALPLVGHLVAHDDDVATAIGGRYRSKHRHQRQRDGTHHHRGSDSGQNQGPGQCTPDPLTTTCGGKCGSVVNNCGAPVDCGTCACNPACPPCQTCDAASGRCVPAANRTNCGGSNICCNGVCCSGCCSTRRQTGGT